MNEYIIELPQLGEITVDFETGPEFTIEATGVPGRQGDPGEPGQDGVSPTVTVTDITGGHRVTITDATGAHSFDVMDGEGGGVQDVQVNGTSVVQNGVANVPVGSDTTPGVVKAGYAYGTYIQNGFLTVYSSNDSLNKAGTSTVRPITPKVQASSVFYGMANAAGDTTQKNSSNAVGNYTENAKSKIKEMLGVGEWQIIKTVTLTEDAASVVINTDETSQSFKLKELFFTAALAPSASTTTNVNAYVRIDPFNYVQTHSGVVRTTGTQISGYAKPITTATSNSEATIAQISGATSNAHWNGKTIGTTLRNYSDYFELYTSGTAKFGAGSVITLLGIRA